MDTNSIGVRLKGLRKNAKITQEEIAEKLNIHVQTVSRWERGATEPDISLLGEIAAILGVTVEKLVGVEETVVYTGSFDAVDLGRKIYGLRHAKGESQQELADAAAVIRDTVSKWERGKICPSIECLITIAEHYKVPFSELYFAAEPEEQEEKEEQGEPTPASQTPSPAAVKRNGLKWLISVAAFVLAAAIALGAYFIFARHKHEFGKWQTVVEATCLEGGMQRRTCSCGETEERETEAKGHDVIIIYGNEPTCKESGYSDIKICRVCEEIFAESIYLPALGHQVSDWIITKQPTKDEDGLRIKKCLRCEEVLREEIIPAA